MFSFCAPTVTGGLTLKRFDDIAGYISDKELRHSDLLSYDSKSSKASTNRMKQLRLPALSRQLHPAGDHLVDSARA
jgi:hypothetical protein